MNSVAPASSLPKTIPKLKCREEAEALMRDIEAWITQVNSYIADRNSEIAKIAAKHDGLIVSVRSLIKEAESALEVWAGKEIPSESEEQSISFTQGKLGFRLCPPAVHLLEGFTDAKVVMKIEEKLSPQYVRIKKEPDYREILKDAAGTDPALSKAELRSIGVFIERDRRFWLKPRIELAK